MFKHWRLDVRFLLDRKIDPNAGKLLWQKKHWYLLSLFTRQALFRKTRVRGASRAKSSSYSETRYVNYWTFYEKTKKERFHHFPIQRYLMVYCFRQCKYFKPSTYIFISMKKCDKAIRKQNQLYWMEFHSIIDWDDSSVR